MGESIGEFEILDVGGLVESVVDEAEDSAVVGIPIEGLGFHDHNELRPGLADHRSVHALSALLALPGRPSAASFLDTDTHLSSAVRG